MLPVPLDAMIVDFADGLAAVVTEKPPEDIGIYKKEPVRAISSRLERGGQILADEKTETALITSRRKRNSVKVKVHG